MSGSRQTKAKRRVAVSTRGKTDASGSDDLSDPEFVPTLEAPTPSPGVKTKKQPKMRGATHETRVKAAEKNKYCEFEQFMRESYRSTQTHEMCGKRQGTYKAFYAALWRAFERHNIVIDTAVRPPALLNYLVEKVPPMYFSQVLEDHQQQKQQQQKKDDIKAGGAFDALIEANLQFLQNT